MGILLVYDVTDDKSFASIQTVCQAVVSSPVLDIKNWIRNIEQHASENVNKILIGNKCDLVEKKVDRCTFFPPKLTCQ